MNAREHKNLIRLCVVTGALAATAVIICDAITRPGTPAAIETIKSAAITFAMMSGFTYLVGRGDARMRGKRR